MPSKFDRLRAGEAVEIEPGRVGRLNMQNKNFETSDGRTIYVGDDPDFFPKDENALKYSREKESLNREIKRAPAGEFLYQFGNQGIAGAAKNWANKITKTGDDYLRGLQVNQQISGEISERSPWTSGAATIASFVPDIALTKGMSALKAAPALTALHSGPRIIENPTEVAQEALLSAAGGKLIDMGGQAISKIVQRRAANRALPGQQQAIAESNRLGEEVVGKYNIQQQNQYNILTRNVKNHNNSLLKQHEIDLESRKNNMIQAKNKYNQDVIDRDNEILRLKNQYELAKIQREANASQLEAEYKSKLAIAKQEEKRLAQEAKTATQNYEESLKKMPELQRAAQSEHAENIVKNSKEIEKSFPKSSRFTTDDLQISQFLDENINNMGLAGTKESNQAKRVLSAIFQEGEIIGGRELSKKYRMLEESIKKASPEVQEVLNSFKTHFGSRLGTVLEDSVVFSKISPIIKRTLEGDINAIFKEINFAGRGAQETKDKVVNLALNNARTALRDGLTPKNFLEKIRNGEFARDLANSIIDSESFLIDLSPSNVNALQKQGVLKLIVEDANRKHQFFIDQLTKKIESRIARNELSAIEASQNAGKKFGTNVRSTYGLAESVPEPIPPSQQPAIEYPTPPGPLPEVPPFNVPPQINPPQTPPLPSNPTLMAEPTAPPSFSFTPQSMPTLPVAQGLGEKIGDMLEKNLLGGKGLIDNPLTKLAGLKYLLGKAALPLEAGYMGLNALTSPTTAGEVLRQTFRQGGIQAIDSWARKYPSYQNGILQSPQDRRSLTKEVEDSSDIPIEQKAIIQSKINRGKRIQENL